MLILCYGGKGTSLRKSLIEVRNDEKRFCKILDKLFESKHLYCAQQRVSTMKQREEVASCSEQA
jgi:hypothetical protein